MKTQGPFRRLAEYVLVPISVVRRKLLVARLERHCARVGAQAAARGMTEEVLNDILAGNSPAKHRADT